MINWFTGQPGSGKTTLAITLKPALRKLSIQPTLQSRLVFKSFCRHGRQAISQHAIVDRSDLSSGSRQNPFHDLSFLGRADQSLVQSLERIAELMSIQAH